MTISDAILRTKSEIALLAPSLAAETDRDTRDQKDRWLTVLEGSLAYLIEQSDKSRRR